MQKIFLGAGSLVLAIALYAAWAGNNSTHSTHANNTTVSPADAPAEPDPWEDDAELADNNITPTHSSSDVPAEPDPWEDDGE